MTHFTYVDNEHALEAAAAEWKRCGVIGVDIECENGLHHYGTFISIVQISTEHRNWVVDVLQINNVTPLISVLEDASVQKIFHDVKFDFSILATELGCRPKNVFDTQIASVLLGKKQVGLGALLEEYFNVHKEHKFQKADWTMRPLTAEMLEYAIGDTAYLIQLRDKLKGELEALGRLSWAQEEFRLLEERKFELTQQKYYEVSGVRQMTDQERGIFRKLFILREHMARRADRPVYFIISTKRLLELSKSPPKSVDEWERMRGIHPIVKRYAYRFHHAVVQGRRECVHFPPLRHTIKLNAGQEAFVERLNGIRIKIGHDLNIAPETVMTRDEMERIAKYEDYSCLHEWQKNLVLQYLEK